MSRPAEDRLTLVPGRPPLPPAEADEIAGPATGLARRIDRLRDFVVAVTREVGRSDSDAGRSAVVGALLSGLLLHDDWLPDAAAIVDPARFRQVLLHADPLARFSVVGVAWGPGQRTPVHDHPFWGVVGVLRGAVDVQHYRFGQGRVPTTRGGPARLRAGDVETVLPPIGEVHEAWNALTASASLSIHVFGADIGRVQRSAYGAGGATVPYVAGYANGWVPNLWGQPRR